MGSFRRTTAAAAAACVLAVSIPLPARAGFVSTSEILADRSVRDNVAGLLVRQEVRDALVARGVDPATVAARVQALTDDEARLLAQEIDRLPAGGDVIGALVAVFLILLITDILGLTKVFPFTRPIR